MKGGETCDDGNTESGDGCSPFCLLEPGTTNAQVPALFCGDGIRSGAEECDLGPDNGRDDSPCSARCAYVYCGDGVVTGSEGCDLGAENGSRYGTQGGCTLACTPSHYCGDGILDSDHGEQCDLGDRNGTSICTVDCRMLAVR
jgi:cysteine-rich repeat protein